eukprot:gene24817-26741_t
MAARHPDICRSHQVNEPLQHDAANITGKKETAMLNSMIKCSLALAVSLAGATYALAASPLRVAMVTSESGLGDRSFNDMMVEGLKKAKADFGIDYVVIQPRAVSDFQQSLARAAGQKFDLIVGSSFDMVKPMTEVAKAFPDQKFGLIDANMEVPNVVAAVAKDWEGSFLAGWVA